MHVYTLLPFCLCLLVAHVTEFTLAQSEGDMVSPHPLHLLGVSRNGQPELGLEPYLGSHVATRQKHHCFSMPLVGL